MAVTIGNHWENRMINRTAIWTYEVLDNNNSARRVVLDIKIIINQFQVTIQAG